MTRRVALGYAALLIGNAVIVQLVAQLAAGQVPVPPQYGWLVPIVLAPLNLLGLLLPSPSQVSVAAVRAAIAPELLAAAAADEAPR